MSAAASLNEWPLLGVVYHRLNDGNWAQSGRAAFGQIWPKADGQLQLICTSKLTSL